MVIRVIWISDDPDDCSSNSFITINPILRKRRDKTDIIVMLCISITDDMSFILDFCAFYLDELRGLIPSAPQEDETYEVQKHAEITENYLQTVR